MPKLPDWFGGSGSNDPPPDFWNDFLINLRAIEAHTAAITTLIPEQTAKLSAEFADVYKNAGPSRGQAGPNREGGRSGYSSLDNIDDTLAGHGRSLGNDWRDRAQQKAIDAGGMSWLHFPGAKPTALDYFDMFSVSAANMAGRKQKKPDAIERQKMYDAAKDIGLIDADGNMSDDTADFIAGTTAPDASKWGTVSNLFAKGKQAYATGRMVRGALEDITRPFSTASNYAYQSGYQGGSPMLLGMRNPFGAAAAGFGQHLSQFGFAVNQNVTPGQAGTIYSSLFNNGWYGGPATNAMRDAASQVMNANPYVAQMPQFYDVMDQATRYGTVSLSHFVDVMKQVPDTAKAANVSIAQTLANMDALGQLNKQMGGTYMGGVNNAAGWQNTTGLSASIMGTLMQNPLVQGQTFMRTGLMPWEQGLASPSQHMNAILGSLNMLSGTIMTPGNKSYADSIGLTQTISGQDQKEALLSHFLGVSKEVVHTMLTNRAGWQAGSTIGQSAQDYSQTVLNDVRGNNMKGAIDTFGGKPWQLMKQQLGTAVDSQGHKMFEDWGKFWQLKHMGVSDAKAHQAAQGYAVQQIDQAGQVTAPTAGHWQSGPRGHGRKWVPGTGGKGYAAAAKARADAITKYQTENTKMFGPTQGNDGQGPHLQIELGPAAKKMFHLQDPNAQQKANQGAGAASVDMNSYATGPTSSPSPNLDTPGGSGSYSYGSQYDTGSY